MMNNIVLSIIYCKMIDNIIVFNEMIDDINNYLKTQAVFDTLCDMLNPGRKPFEPSNRWSEIFDMQIIDIEW